MHKILEIDGKSYSFIVNEVPKGHVYRQFGKKDGIYNKKYIRELIIMTFFPPYISYQFPILKQKICWYGDINDYIPEALVKYIEKYIQNEIFT